MGDRRSYGSASSRNVAAERSQRSLFMGIAFFVAALLVIGGILFAGRSSDDDPQQGLLVTEATSTTQGGDTPTLGAADTETATSPSTQAPPTSTQPSAPNTATATEALPSETQTTEGDEDVDEVDTEPTEDTSVIVEPTEELEEVVPSDDEEPPFVGDFGTLPPAQIVSGGLSRSLSLDYELAVSLDSSPSSATVYQLAWPAWSEDEVASIASNLGIEGAVEGGPGSYQVFGETSEIYFSGSTVQYVYTGGAGDGGLGDNSTVIATASSWMYNNGFISTDLDGGVVIGRDDDAGRAIVLFKPAAVSPILSFIPNATVTVGPGGTVLEANIRWPSDYIPSEYGLWSGNALWNTILAGRGSVEADLSVVGGSGALTGTMTVYEIWVAYSYAGTPGGEEYLVPLVVFSGEATINETGDTIPVSVYVSAVAGQSTPQG